MADRSTFALVGPAYPYRGGIAHFMASLHRTLAARGHRVADVTFRRQYPELLFPGKTQLVTDEAPPAAPPPRLLDTLSPLSWWQTAAHLAALRPDAVVFQYWMPFFAPAYAAIAWLLRRQGVRVLAVVHNALPHERRPGDRWLSRLFLRLCDGGLALSEAVAADIRALAPHLPIEQAEHPVYDHFGAPVAKAEARARLGLDPAAPVLLFFGFVRRYKGLHVLLEALPQVAAQVPDVQLVVAGEFYENEAAYRNQLVALGVEPHVQFRSSYIPDAEVAPLFGAADVVVQPYVTATQSGVAQIAYHFERPLIVTDVGGLAEVVPHEEAGLVVPPEDPAALAAALVRFFADALGPKLQAGVRTQRQRYSWDRVAEALEGLARDPGGRERT